MRITRSQIARLVEAYGDIPDDINFQVAMKIKDMMPPDEALGMSERDFRDLIISVFDDHFDETGEGWDPYPEDIKEIEDHLTIIPEPGDPDYDSHMYESKTNTFREGKMRIKKKKLRKVIREAIREATDMVNRETGEVISFGDRHNDVAPDKAVNDIMKRLGISPKPEHMRTTGADGFDIELSNDDFMKVEDETIGKQDSRARKRKSAQMAADRERLNIDNLLQRLRHWAEDAASDYMADNPDMDLQDIAYDLADAWEFEFEKDEREELLWYFDGDLNDLKIYAAESMG